MKTDTHIMPVYLVGTDKCKRRSKRKSDEGGRRGYSHWKRDGKTMLRRIIYEKHHTPCCCARLLDFQMQTERQMRIRWKNEHETKKSIHIRQDYWHAR